MLPTVTPGAIRASDSTGVSSRSGLPCSTGSGAPDDPRTAAVAARRCHNCPIATPCLLEGLRLDAAWRRREDPWGAFGVWGGIWFSPGHRPVSPLEAHPYDYDRDNPRPPATTPGLAPVITPAAVLGPGPTRAELGH